MRVELDPLDLAKFPFLKEAEKWVSDNSGSINQFIRSSRGRIAAKAGAERIKTAIVVKHPKFINEKLRPPDPAIFAYVFARVLASCIKDRLIIERLSRFEAARAWYFFQEEENNEKREDVAESIGIELDSLRIKVINYVDLVPNLISFLQDDKWKLVNRQVTNGWVKIERDELEDLIRERIRFLFHSELPRPVPPEICEELSPLIEEIKAVQQETLMSGFGEVEEGAFPPCLQALITAITAGTNLPHAGRFTITAFLHNIGMSPVQIMEIFARAPDFDPEKTRYQVEHISGRGGTEYTAPSCATLRTTGFCVKKDSLCDRVNHPLSYYRIRKKREKGREKEGENDGEKEPVRQSSP
jgi:DNA primase large subunit